MQAHGTVGCPVVQKFHSAVATFGFNTPKRGVVLTAGRFTSPVEGYTERLQQNGDSDQIKWLDSDDLFEITNEVGLDLYNGRIEIHWGVVAVPTTSSRVRLRDDSVVFGFSFTDGEMWHAFEFRDGLVGRLRATLNL